MAQQTINIGSSANDGTGDPLRTAFDKINDNFTELYGSSPFGKQVTISGNEVFANASNADLILNGNGTGGVIASAIKISGTTISSDDSTQVQVNENLDVDGNITASGNITATGNIFAKGNINLGDAAGDQTKVVGVFEADNIQIDGTTITTNTTNGSVSITGNGTGGVNIDNLTFNDNSITSASNADINLTPGGTGGVVAGGVRIKGTSLSADDSSVININEGLVVDGTGNFSGTLTTAAISTTGTHTVTGQLNADNLRMDGNTISSTDSNGNIVLTPNGSGAVKINGISIEGAGTDKGHITTDDSTAVTFGESVNVQGGITISGTTTTAGVSTTGNTTISGSLTAGSVNVGDLNISADGTITTDTNGDVNIDPAGTGAINLTAATNVTGTATVTGQLNVDNLRMDANTISATTGGITISPATNQNLALGGLVTATELQSTLGEFTTLRTDTLSTDTSNGDLTIGTQGTGKIVLDVDTISRTGDLELDVSGSIYLDADSGTIFIQDGTAGTFGQLIRAGSNDLTIASGSTQALIFTGANAAFQNNISVAGTLNTHTIPGGTGTLALTSTAQGAIPTAGNTGTGSIGVGDTLQALGTTNEINVDAAGSALSFSLADNISGVTSITVSGSLNTDGILIVDNSISSDRSNDDLTLDANGTGQIVFRAPIQINEGIEEKFETVTGASGVTALDCSKGHIFYKTGCTGDITANFTNLTLSQEYATNLTVIINQGGTPYEITAVQIGGAGQTLNWQGGSAPTGNANGIDAFSFTILNDGGSYVVLGQMVDFT